LGSKLLITEIASLASNASLPIGTIKISISEIFERVSWVNLEFLKTPKFKRFIPSAFISKIVFEKSE